MENLHPVLFGWDVKELWDYIHPIALSGWAVLCLVPRWKYTFSITLFPPLIHALLYSSILLPMMLVPDPSNPSPNVDLADMESVFNLFAIPDVFFCGWVHYLAFDLLVARGLAMDAIQACNVSNPVYYFLVVPCLLATLYVGPVGYLMYMIVRATVLAPVKGAANEREKEE